MSNRNQIEIVSKIFNLKERQTAKGYMYSFSVPINGQTKEGDKELTEWLQGVIFTKERVMLADRCEALFTAHLEVKPPYQDRPQQLGFTGYEIQPVFNKVYKISNKPKNQAQPQQQPGQQQHNYNGTHNATPQQQGANPLPNEMDYIPF